MKNLAAFILALLLTGVINGCVPAGRYENLKAQRDELQQSLARYEQMLADARKDRLRATTELERQNRELHRKLALTSDELIAKQEALDTLAKKYEVLSQQASATAENILALIAEKKKLNATIVELKGTIATLSDTIKDLRRQLDEARTKPPQTDQLGHQGQSPLKVPE